MDAMMENLEMDLLDYCVAPKKLQSSIELVGLGNFTIISTLEGSIFNYPPPKM